MSLPLPLYPDKIFPEGFLQLCNDEISGLVECNVLFLHTLMLEVGYIPKDVDECDMYQKMPETWRGNEAYSISYYHKSIPNIFCNVTCVRLYNRLAIHGLLEDETDETNTVFLRIHVNDPLSLLCDTNKLAIKIKDELCFPLLVLLQERVNFKPSFGLGGLINDCKLAILKHLNVESVVSISEVNKEFHDRANSSFLWKHLFTRDFGSDVSSHENSSSTEDWKEKYIEEYVERRTKEEEKERKMPREGGFQPILVFDPTGYRRPGLYPYSPYTTPYASDDESEDLVNLWRNVDPYQHPRLHDPFRPSLPDPFGSRFGTPPRRDSFYSDYF